MLLFPVPPRRKRGGGEEGGEEEAVEAIKIRPNPTSTSMEREREKTSFQNQLFMHKNAWRGTEIKKKEEPNLLVKVDLLLPPFLPTHVLRTVFLSQVICSLPLSPFLFLLQGWSSHHSFFLLGFCIFHSPAFPEEA